ncbi:MAG: hypothetical protein WC701_10695 [Kiritimatiellales bacterium]|jgi:hypothetical protein
MDALLKFLCEKLWPLMVDRWGRRSTVLALEISMILTLLVWLTNGAIDTVSLAQGGFIVTAAVLLWLVWYGTVRIPKCKRGRIGIALAVCAEDEEQDRLLKSDFIDEFKEIIDKSAELRDLFDIVEIPRRHAWSIRTTEQAISYRDVARCHMIIYGHARNRTERKRNVIKVHLDCVIAHQAIKKDVSKAFSKDMSAIFPGRLDIDAEDECQQFEITAEWLSLSAKYIVGTAALLSAELDLALSIFNSLYYDPKLKSVRIPSVQNIRARVPIRLADIYRMKIHPLFIEWDKTHDTRFLEQVREYLPLLDDVVPNHYSVRLWWSFVYFVLDKDIDKSVHEINRCRDQRDATWRYSRAFLFAYSGQLEDAKNEYEKAFDRGCHESVPLQCESFMLWVLGQEPDKTQLYYCLGLINWKAKGDLSQAICDMEKFISQASDAEYSEMKQLARANLGTIKGELKEGK